MTVDQLIANMTPRQVCDAARISVDEVANVKALGKGLYTMDAVRNNKLCTTQVQFYPDLQFALYEYDYRFDEKCA